MLIAHLADIHLRGLSRHLEYKRTFEEFVQQAKNKKVDLIFIAGDIFHTKTTGISPEYIQFMDWWLKLLSSVAPVHMILGNHDGLVNNNDRLDAVTPIINMHNKDRIKLYKHSGVYDLCAGYKLCVYSIFDRDNWDKVKPVDGFFNFAAYHGPVNSAKTEQGWELKSDLEVSFFEGYDAVLLGDIHKQQYLAYKTLSSGVAVPWIAYPGSTLQQNYAEDIDHGYLLWDINSKDDYRVSFCKLTNQHPYVTINWMGTVSSTLLQASGEVLPESRVRIKSNNYISYKEMFELNKRLKEDLKALEITYKVDQQQSTDVLSTGALELVRDDLRSPEVLFKLVKEHHNGLNFDQQEAEKIKELIKKYIDNLVLSDESIRHIKWSIKDLVFDNLFSYGKGNRVNFDALDGIVGIVGPNTVGKSSIFGAVMYVLYNSTDRGKISNQHICNVRKQSCSGRILVRVGTTDYVIERTTTKHLQKDKQEYANTSLGFWKVIDANTLEDKNSDSRTDSDKEIRKLIGTADDFLLTSFSSQGMIDQFVKQGSAQRKAVISRFLDLDVFDKLHDLIKEDSKDIKSQLKSYPDKDWSGIAKEYKQKLVDIDNKNVELDTCLVELRQQALQINSELTNIDNNRFIVTPDELQKHRSHVADLHQVIKTLREQISSSLTEQKDVTSKIKELSSVFSDDALEEVKKKLLAARRISDLYRELQNKHDKIEDQLNTHVTRASVLKVVPCNNKFPDCKFIKDANVSNDSVDSYKNMLQEAVERLEKCRQELDELAEDVLRSKLIVLEKAQSELTSLKFREAQVDYKLKTTQSVLKQRLEELDVSKEKLAKLEELALDVENVKINELKNKLSNVNKEIKKLEDERISLAVTKGHLESDIKKLLSENKIRKTLLHKLSELELLQSAFSKKGVPNKIILSQLPALNAEIANILSGIVEFVVEFDTDSDNDKLELYINYGDSRRLLELGSGMEKMVSSIAIRVALINMSTLSKSDIFVIDEGFGSLDDVNVEATTRLLRSLTKYFKTVIVMTHVDQVKDSVDLMLEIKKQEKDSIVVYN